MFRKIVDKLLGCLRGNRLTREIVINVESLETRVAVVENGRANVPRTLQKHKERKNTCSGKLSTG